MFFQIKHTQMQFQTQTNGAEVLQCVSVCPFACAHQEKKKSGILHFFYFSQVKEKLGNLCLLWDRQGNCRKGGGNQDGFGRTRMDVIVIWVGTGTQEKERTGTEFPIYSVRALIRLHVQQKSKQASGFECLSKYILVPILPVFYFFSPFPLFNWEFKTRVVIFKCCFCSAAKTFKVRASYIYPRKSVNLQGPALE